MKSPSDPKAEPTQFQLQTAVSEPRWKEAQQWEEAHWVNTQRVRGKYFKNQIWKVLNFFGFVEKYRGDDWNLWWKKQFDEYRFLPSNITNALEVGCGPYTNIRHMMDQTKFDHMFLSDPLIRTYVRFKLTFVAEMYRQAACMLDDHPIESLPFREDYFDLVVMINVLDHVQDADKCMENILRVLKPGGIFILGQDLSNEEDKHALQVDPGAIGHPIKLDEAWFTPYLDAFEPITSKTLSRTEGRSAENHYATLIFAGRLKGTAA